MAKKSNSQRNTERRERHDLTKVCAFWGIVIAAVVMFVNFIISLIAKLGVTIGALNTICGILNIVSMVALLVAVALPAYSYVRGRNKNWKIVYWVSLILYICGIIRNRPYHLMTVML